MDAGRALFLFNSGLLALAVFTESVMIYRDRRRRSRFAWLGVLRVLMLLLAWGIVLVLNSEGLIPEYNPMRVVLTLVLLHITIRDVYDVAARL